MICLNNFKHNNYSQWGEDGILARLFEELKVEKGTFCEFGAWDGMHMSNTYSLYLGGWDGVYIEGDKARFVDLKENIDGDRIDLICAYVHPEGENTIDGLLSRSRVVGETGRLDLLSIDIDSDDLAVFESMEKYRASVVIIEYNPTIPLELEYVNPLGENKGNSARSILQIAERKGYVLVAVTVTNLILVAQECLPRNIMAFGIQDFDIFPGIRYFFGYDGTLLCSRIEGDVRVVLDREVLAIPWKKAFFVQPAPRVFRSYAQGPVMNYLLLCYSVLSALLVRPLGFLGERYRRWRHLAKRKG